MDKLKRTNQWLTFAASIGVIVGLVVLIFEINQNTIAIENQVDVAVFSLGPIGYLIEHRDLAELSVRSKSEPWDSFSMVEQERMGFLWGSFLDSAELQYRLRQRGGEMLNADNIAFPEALLSQDAFTTWWEQAQMGGAYPPEFVNFFNSYLSERRK